MADSERKTEDVRLWKQWKKSQSSPDLQALLNHLQPVINSQVNRWAGTLSRDTLETKAKILAADAIRGYDPKAGAALATHVTNQLQKLSRTVYTHTQAARLPEHKVIGMVSFHAAQEQLKNDLGHDPTTSQLADNLGWGSERIQEFQRAYNRKEMLGSGEFNPASFSTSETDDPMASFVYHDMAPPQQRLFEHITGFGGKEVLSNEDIMKKFDLTQGQLSYQKRKLIDLFDKAQK